MRQPSKSGIAGAVALAAAWLLAVPAWAGYNWGGNGMEVASGTVSNGAVYMQSVPHWPSYTNATGGYSTQFTAPACDDVVASRLVLGLYGGSASNTATVTVTVNGVPTSVTIGGGTADSNPEFTTGQTNVYGSMSSGAWVVSVPIAADLNINGDANNVNVTVSDPSNNFDGRLVYASLWDVYQKASLKNSFQYAVAEGSGDFHRHAGSDASFSRVLHMKCEFLVQFRPRPAYDKKPQLAQ